MADDMRAEQDWSRYELNTGGITYEGYKSDVLDTFLQDSLKVARKTVLARANTGLPTVGEETAYRSTAEAERARQQGYDLVKGGHYGTSGRRQPKARRDDGGSSVASSGTNAGLWKGAGSDVASNYPTTAVTSRVPSTVIRETLARVERLEAHLQEERLKREETEQQLMKLRTAHQAQVLASGNRRATRTTSADAPRGPRRGYGLPLSDQHSAHY